jgi:hypothetical protein
MAMSTTAAVIRFDVWYNRSPLNIQRQARARNRRQRNRQ